MEECNFPEKKLNSNTYKLIGKNQLHQYGVFSETFDQKITKFLKKLRFSSNIHDVPNGLIVLESKCIEDVTILNLVNSDNKLLAKMLASLASICYEMNIIIEEAEEIYQHFINLEAENTLIVQKKKTYHFIDKYYRKLQSILSLTFRSQQVICLLISQLNSLVGKGLYSSSVGSNFSESIEHLAELLVCIIILENLLDSHIIREYCDHYLIMVKNLSHDPNKFKFSADQLQFLERNIEEMHSRLLTGNIFQDVTSYCASTSVCFPGVASEFVAHITEILNELDRDEDTILFTQLWLQANALVAFYCSLYGDIEKKVIKKLLEVNKKRSFCTLPGQRIWYADEFLLKQVPKFSKILSSQNSNIMRINTLNSKNLNIMKESHNLALQASLCMMNLEKVVKQDMTMIDSKHIENATEIFIETMKVLKKTSELIKWILGLHSNQNIPIGKSPLLAFCRLIEILKCFQLLLTKNLVPETNLIMLISQHLTYKALSMVMTEKKNLVQDKYYKQKQLDVLSSLSICEQAIKGPNTRDRLLVAKLALSASGISKDTALKIKYIINRLQLITSIQSLFHETLNCSFLYEHFESLIPTYFSKLLENKADLSRYYLMVSALDDCLNLNAGALEIINDFIKQNFLDCLIQNVETNLRLQTHLHLALPPSNPFSNYIPINFSTVAPIKLGNNVHSSKNETEHFLSKMFYNLTTVVLHDWQTYGEMRRLAKLQYNLETVEDNLPMQTIEQGLDVLEIMRNINVFVTKYLYNLNSQVFVEEKGNKHLNTINISHIANSIRTHGIGIMNTTVNFTYQFLQKKFFIFSQFMFDEQIKSRLLKDFKYFSTHRTEYNQMYPYERAEKFNNGIKKLGLDENGQSYLDLFRKLISCIGNAMGYVRLIRSGGRRCLAEGTCFIPDLKQIENLSIGIPYENMPELTKTAKLKLDHELNILLDNFEEATEYFTLLVNVLGPVLKDSKNVHLKNFFIIIPALTINFVENMITCKERLNKNRDDAAFTDDGFAMGLAFIIELLDQEQQFNSLHWFHSVRSKLLSERKNILEQRTKGSKDEDKLQQTLSLTERRIATYEREFQLLYCNYRSARIFFQS